VGSTNERPGSKSRLRDKLTYANLVATAALFLALGGGAYGALRVPPHSVGARQLKSQAVTRGKVADGAIDGVKVADASLTGSDIDLGALGTVPSAATAANASNAERLSDHQAACPSATVLIRGVCFDATPNPEAPNLETAALDCAGKGGYLPTPMELYSARGTLGIYSSDAQFTDSLFHDEPTSNEYLTIVVKGVGLPEEHLASSPASYYCAYSLLR
jgi:hypothetical protein